MDNIFYLIPPKKGKMKPHRWAVNWENVFQRLENGTLDPNVRDNHGRTLVHYAVNRADEAGIEYLAAHGASLDKQTYKLGHTPLHQAVFLGNLLMVQCLLSHGANARIKHHGGLTAEQEARQNGHAGIAHYFFRKRKKLGWPMKFPAFIDDAA